MENTLWLEILVITITIAFFLSLIGVYIYKKIHHIPTGECSSCIAKKKNLLKAYYKKYPKGEKHNV